MLDSKSTTDLFLTSNYDYQESSNTENSPMVASSGGYLKKGQTSETFTTAIFPASTSNPPVSSASPIASTSAQPSSIPQLKVNSTPSFPTPIPSIISKISTPPIPGKVKPSGFSVSPVVTPSEHIGNVPPETRAPGSIKNTSQLSRPNAKEPNDSPAANVSENAILASTPKGNSTAEPNFVTLEPSSTGGNKTMGFNASATPAWWERSEVISPEQSKPINCKILVPTLIVLLVILLAFFGCYRRGKEERPMGGEEESKFLFTSETEQSGV